MIRRTLVLVAAFNVGAGIARTHAADYQIDQWNGAPDAPILSTPNPGQPYWIYLVNQFTVESGREYISEIQSVRFARANSSAVYGIWSDPNNDGNPTDAQLIWSTQVDNIAPIQSLSLQSIPVPFVRAGNAGDGFFIGWMSLTPYYDQDLVNAWALPAPFLTNRSWFGSAASPTDPNDLDTEFAPDYPFLTWVVRANGIPSPATPAVLGVLSIRLFLRRRRTA